MSETVTVKGKVYQIGKIYRSLATSEIGYFGGYEGGSFKLFRERSVVGAYIASSQITDIEGDIGTITEAPLELEDGQYYMLDTGHVMLFEDGLFRSGPGQSYPNGQKHIKPIHKMVKAND